MRAKHPSLKKTRGGFTLIEMLVVVVLVVLMMMVLVMIFSATTSAITVSRTLQGLDQELRQLDATLRRDLNGATARLVPPQNPSENRGYFEYSENAFADIQGEDTDDTLRLTVQAPQGQPFVGRMTFNVYQPNGKYACNSVPVTSEFAEVVYFLRNGNLYRRTLLVMPERKGSLQIGLAGNGAYSASKTVLSGTLTTPFSLVSWQALNDISARPQFSTASSVPTPNSLGDLTNRENRMFSPRFCDDFLPVLNGAIGDDMPDDSDKPGSTGFGIPDYWPTLYPAALYATSAVTNQWLVRELNSSGVLTRPWRAGYSADVLPFPYLFPGMYSQPSPIASVPYKGGAVHSLDPTGQTYNHAPLASGDSLLVPSASSQAQTWWGFPTWRETVEFTKLGGWQDPVWRINNSGKTPLQPQGLSLGSNFRWLPPQDGSLYSDVDFSIGRNAAAFSDGVGSATFNPSPGLWEEDLLMTGVRSFDIKAFEPNAVVYDFNLPANPFSPGNRVLGAGYYDLGYLSLWCPGDPLKQGSGFLTGFPAIGSFTPPQVAAFFLQNLGHEGRMPPLTTDFRADAQWPLLSPNVGDDDLSGVGVVRLRRVYDTWSTTYTNAPASPLDNPLNGPPYAPPVYPSYPAPYTAPLRGIQIQLRVVDPKSERERVLTIRQDFTDKR